MPAEDIKLYAKWSINTYTLTFDTNGGSAISPITEAFDTVLTVSNPTRTGYTFEGFYKDILLTDSYAITNMPAEDITLYAKWSINEYIIIYVTNAKDTLEDDVYNYDNDIVLKTITKLGHTFDGWFLDESFNSKMTLTSMPENDITLYAKWSVNTYKITVYPNNNTDAFEVNFNFGDLITIDTPTRDGYQFNGYHIDLPKNMPANDFLLNATWSLVKHQSDSNLITTSNLDAISAKYINKNQNVNLILDIKIIDKAVLPAETNSLISNHIKK